MIIKEVRIKNFRSIVSCDFQLADLNVFAGLNDVGKSNVLKALNLFFNSNTDANTPLNFQEDYSKLTPLKAKKAKEIIVQLVLLAPQNYRESKDILWTRKWRRNNWRENTLSFTDGTPFPKRSKIPSWLQNIDFRYVPAIKGETYFKNLLGDLHDTLAETIEDELKEAGADFIAKIKEKTQEIKNNVDTKLQISSEIRLPSNLQELFRTLEFETVHGAFSVALNQRGDGIKTRHIPIILKFLADQANANRAKGSPRVNTIWGYEEPENNLEMRKSFELAREFLDYSNSIQILLTTHSPGFYSLGKDHPQKVKLYYLSAQNNQGVTVIQVSNDTQQLDSDLGILPLITPYIEEKIEENKKAEILIIKLQDEAKSATKQIVFVEGKFDQMYFDKINAIVGKTTEITVKTEEGFGGCSYVRDQCIAWSHLATSIRAIGIFDRDESGEKSYKSVEIDPNYKDAVQKKKVKIEKFKPPKHLLELYGKNILVPVEIEEMITPKYWAIAESKGWLVDRENLYKIVRPADNKTSIEQTLINLGLKHDEILYVTKQIPDNHKEQFAKLITKLEDPESYEAMQELIDFFNNKVVSFLLAP